MQVMVNDCESAADGAAMVSPKSVKIASPRGMGVFQTSGGPNEIYGNRFNVGVKAVLSTAIKVLLPCWGKGYSPSTLSITCLSQTEYYATTFADEGSILEHSAVIKGA